MKRVAPWKAYGGTWQSFGPQAGVPEVGTCESCQQPCGHNWTTFPAKGQEPDYTYVKFTISDGTRVLSQDIDEEPIARLMAQAPAFQGLLQELISTDPLCAEEGWSRCFFCEAEPDEFPGQPRFVPHSRDCLWRRVAESLEAAEKPLFVYGRDDYESKRKKLTPLFRGAPLKGEESGV